MASTAGTGYITTAGEMANTLYEENRDYNNRKTWENLFSGNNASAAQSQQALTNSYTDASVSAYVSYLQSQQALKNSSIVGAGRNDIAQAYDASLANTQASYQSSLYEGQNEIETARQENENNIYSALEEQAEYSAEYTNAHYDYLQYLYEEYENGNNTLFDIANWKKYINTTALTDEEGNELTDTEGNVMYETSLKTWDQLSQTTTDDNGEYSSIYDENGNLTKFGIEFFDQLENSWDTVNNGTNTSNTWSTYLKDYNEDLYDWASTYNYYNYTQAGTNAGTMRTMYGMMSTDMTYSYLERMGGMTTAQVNEIFSTVEDLNNQILELASEEGHYRKNYRKLTKDTKKRDSLTTQYVDALEQLSIDLNIDYALEEAGLDWKNVKSMMQDIVNNGPGSDMSAVGAGATGVGMSAGAIAQAVTAGGILNSAAGGLAGWEAAAAVVTGTVGAAGLAIVADVVIGAVVLGIAIWQVVESVKNNKLRKQALNNINDAFSQLAVNLSDFKNTNINNGRQKQLIY